jgi:eukaryotic-like serine/threonine-protein kinase
VTPDRWARLKQIFGEVLETPEAKRPQVLEALCGNDAGLRMEVERLLAANADGSWQSPAANLLTTSPALAAGDTVSHYTIEAKLGEGGMGIVYRASDSRLGRSVALKFSRAGFGSWAEREARAVAALNHPNICTLYDVGPDYLAMELVEGVTLAERIARGALPLEEALDLSRARSPARWRRRTNAGSSTAI